MELNLSHQIIVKIIKDSPNIPIEIRDVVTAFDLGKKTVSKIKQNIFLVFAYNTGLIPIAAGVLVPFIGIGIFGWLPILAGIAMALSSVTIVTNSLLLG